MEPLWARSAADLAGLIRERQVSSLELTQAVLGRIERLNGRLTAIVQYDRDRAITAARAADDVLARRGPSGPLHGVPVTVKDTFDTAGIISTGGTLGRAQFIPPADATVVRLLRAAGALVLGKTNVPEFAMAVETDNLLYGRTNNPYDLAHTAGGSSGGPAAAVAAGLSALEVGSDGGGSIRLPAHYCGVAALKATPGRISQAGHFPEPYGSSSRMLACGPIARRVRDLRLALSVLGGEDWDDPLTLPVRVGVDPPRQLDGLRVAFYCDDGVGSPTNATVDTVRRCAAALVQSGCHVSEAIPPALADASEIHLGIIINDRHLILEWMRESGTTSDRLHPWVRDGLAYLNEAAEDLGADFGSMVFYELRRYQKKALAFMRDFDVLLSPVAAGPAPLHGEGVQGEAHSGYVYSTLHNVTGWPAAVVRCGTSPEGLPIGAQVAALPFRDELVLQVSEHLETVFGGWQSPPEI